MTSSDPMRPESIETVLFEPDHQRMIAVLPGAVWLAPGDVVELDDPPRDARVLSARLQLRDGQARILIVLDVPDDSQDALRGDTPTEVLLGSEVDEPDADLSAELDRDLAELDSELEDSPESPAGS